jgi:hypothetical protein
MTASSIVRRQVALAGRVMDKHTGKPIADAQVDISGVSLAHGTTRTRQDGVFYFMDLPNGEYALRASNPSGGRAYGTAEAKATVARDSDANIKVAYVDFLLPATCVKGRVTSRSRGNGVLMAEVRMKGSGERTLSDVHGHYVLAGVETSKSDRTVTVTAQGYKATSQPVRIEQPGVTNELDFTLEPEGGGANSAPSSSTARARPAGSRTKES